ncbi:MAG: hypothetical protein K0S86_1323, partial [Geminicoccaceae bacterium]|nr:hypothetical protein [Geminicoccaceae bacterium]
FPDDDNTWYVWIDNLGGNTPSVGAYAICANVAA